MTCAMTHTGPLAEIFRNARMTNHLQRFESASGKTRCLAVIPQYIYNMYINTLYIIYMYTYVYIYNYIYIISYIIYIVTGGRPAIIN